MNLAEYLRQDGRSQTALAKALGVTQGAVWQWANGRRPIPADRCPAIERATAGAVTCEELRPDVDWSVLRAPPLDPATRYEKTGRSGDGAADEPGTPPARGGAPAGDPVATAAAVTEGA
jgi:transcriptional regulator with XRE-family HTH domain